LVVGSTEKPEQIVVVNGGDDRADQTVKAFMGSEIDVQLVRTANRNLAASRNVGLSYCKGDIVAMTDDDAEVPPDWVGLHKRAHEEHHEAGAIGGFVEGSNLDSLICRVAEIVTFPRWPAARYVRTLPGVNISYKRSVLSRIGLQDEALFRGEDVDYNWRVKRAGYEIYFDPKIGVSHAHRTTLRGLLNQHFMYGRAYYLVRRKWPDMYCIYPHQLRTVRDVCKLVNSVASICYQPILSAFRMRSHVDKVIALPIFFGLGLSWKGGMLCEMLIQLQSRHPRSRESGMQA
jgi:GT2 family glycosyltransferase